MKCYKFVKREKNKLLSIFSHGKFQVRYKKGRYATAPSYLKKVNYHLLAFRTINDALDFATICLPGMNTLLFEAEGQERVFLPLYLSLNWSRRREFPNFQSYFNWVRTVSTVMSWPHNTLMFKKIKLIKEVEYGPLFTRRGI